MEFAAAATNPVPAIIHISRSSPRPAMPLLGAGVTEAVGTEVTPGRVVAVDIVLVEPDFDAEEAVVVVTTSARQAANMMVSLSQVGPPGCSNMALYQPLGHSVASWTAFELCAAHQADAALPYLGRAGNQQTLMLTCLGGESCNNSLVRLQIYC